VFTNLSPRPVAVTILVIDFGDNIQSSQSFAAVLTSQSVLTVTAGGQLERCVFDFQGVSAKFVRAAGYVVDSITGEPQLALPAS